MDLGLKGRTAVVTGADSGMGLATARMLLDEGARVVISEKTADTLKHAAQGLSAHGEFHAIAADLTDLASVESLRDAAMQRLGQVDILVNAAGVTGPTGPFHTIADDVWLSALQIDLMGAVRVVRAFIPGMMERKSGHTVLFGSEDAEQPYADELPYCAAKAAILNLSKGLSKSYAEHGIMVNAVSPAFIATPMTDAMMEACDVIIANLTPFRGASADSGTLIEVGWFLGRGRPVFGYSNSATCFAARCRRQLAALPDQLPGLSVEGFGLPDNLMIQGTMLQGGGQPIVLPADGQDRPFDSLAMFEACVARVARS